MATTFTFRVLAPGSTTGAGVNLFARLNNGAFNIERRFGAADAADNYTLTLTLTPAEIQPAGAAQLTINARRNGAAFGNHQIFLISSNETVAAIGTSLITDVNSNAVISLVGVATGVASVSAYLEINGRVVPSNVVVLTVAQFEGPEDYNATGNGQLELTIESSLANALTPRVQWLSHAEQKQKYPDDTGLRMLLWYENSGEIIFIPKSMQQ